VLFIATHHQITTETAGCADIPTAMYVQAMKARQQDEEFRAKLINLTMINEISGTNKMQQNLFY